jgi:hypothetical protein
VGDAKWWTRPILAEEHDEIRSATRMLAVKPGGPIALLLSEERAPLLEAAPDLYAALDEIVVLLPDCLCGAPEKCNRCRLLRARRAALARARGETP